MIYYNLAAKPDVIENHYNQLKDIITGRIKVSNLLKSQKDFLLENLKAILTDTPENLLELNTSFYAIRKSNFKLAGRLKSIFDYNSFANKDKLKYCAYSLAEKLNVRTCLYCNRQYTLTVINKKHQITRPEFDHFFAQSKYPILALSIYNLIPSCHICNSTLKRAKEFNLTDYVHPYVHNVLPEYKYTYLPHSITAILGGSSKLEIKIDSDKKPHTDKINETKKVFKLEEIYNGHTEELTDLFDIRYKLSERYLEELMNTYKHLGINKEEIYKLAFGVHYNEEDFVRRPFSKIKKDLLKELGII